MTVYRIVIEAVPRTKKTSPEIVLLPSKDGRGQACPCCKRKLLTIPQPSAKWKEWVRVAKITMNGYTLLRVPMLVNGEKVLVTHALKGDGSPAVKLKPIDVPMMMEAVFWREANRGDLFGFYQGVGDLLQAWGIISNDVLIRSTPGVEPLRKDAARPRVELLLTPIEVESEQLAAGFADQDHHLEPLSEAEEASRA